MAEILNVKNNLPVKLDVSKEPFAQPEGTNRFCLNAVTDHRHLGSVVNEPGNVNVTDLPANSAGKIPIDRYRTIILTVDGSINEFDSRTGVVTTHALIPDTPLSEPITGRYRVRNGCEEIIYWGNGIQPDMFFNISNPEIHQDDAGNFVADKFKFHYDLVHPVINTQILNYGGNLEKGTYQFAVKYVDSFNNELFISPIDINYTPITDEAQSIRLTISNIDSKVDYIQIIAIRYSSNDIVTSEIFLLDGLLSSNTSIEYLFTHITPEDKRLTTGEITVPNAFYETSLAKEQIQNIFLRANLKESVRDYSGYQRAASKICTKYAVDEVSLTDPQIHIKNRTYPGGEIESPGIVYVHKDGSISPVFHIPGRASVESDFHASGITQAYEKLVNYRFYDMGVFDGSGHKRIEISYTFDLPIPGLSFQLVTQSGGTYYPVGVWDETEGTLIFIVPTGDFSSGTLKIHTNVTTLVHSIFWLFDGDPDKIGEFILADEEDLPMWQVYDTSIKDVTPVPGYDSTGKPGYYGATQIYENPPNYCGNDSYWGIDCDGNELDGLPVRYHAIPDSYAEPHYDGFNIRPIGLIFDNIEYPDDDIVGHYFVIGLRSINRIVAKGVSVQFMNNELGDGHLYDEGRYFQEYPTPTPVDQYLRSYYRHFISLDHLFNRDKIEGTYLLHENTIINQTSQQDYNVDNLYHDDMPYKDAAYYQKNSYLTNYVPFRGIHEIEETTTLVPRSNLNGIYNWSYSNEFTINELTTEINPLEFPAITYASIRNPVEIFRNVWSIRYRRISDLSSNESFTGDHFVSGIELTNISWTSVEIFGFIKDFFSGADDLAKFEYEYIQNLFTISEANGYLRLQGEQQNECDRFYESKEYEQVSQYISQSVNERYEGKFKVRDSFCQFYSGWERHFGVTKNLNQYNHLRQVFNFCTECLGEYRNRIIFSETSYDGESIDSYRTYRALNFVDLPANKGAIIAMDYKNDRLVVRCEYGSFILAPNPQQLQASESTIHIGTGAFLSIPPRELNVVDIGYGGQQHPFESINIDQGLMWVDRQRGHIFLFGGKFNNLAEGELEGWFDHYMRNAANSQPVVMAYDPEHERVVFTMRDNWSISYCFKINGWRSWHSYRYNTYFNDANTFFSIDGTKIRRHNSSVRAYFGSHQYPFIIEYTIPDIPTFYVESVFYYANTYIESGYMLHDDLDTTFDSIIVYNNAQSTGEQTLRHVTDSVTNVFFTPGTTNVIQTDRNYKVGPLVDYAISSTIWTEGVIDPLVIWIDKTPTNISFAKNQHELGTLRDKWASVRLSYTPEARELASAQTPHLSVGEPRKMVVNLAMILEHYSIR